MDTWEIIIEAAIPSIVASIVAAIFAVIAWIASRLRVKFEAFLNTKEKREIARIVVRSIEQTVENLHGADKLAQALIYFHELASERGITCGETEAKLMIEAEVNEMNADTAVIIDSSDDEETTPSGSDEKEHT